MTPDIIGVTGQMGAGKNAIGKILEGHGYTQVGFADQLKSMALVLNPFIPFTGAGFPERLSVLVGDRGWEAAKEFPEVRRFLQVLGTEGVRAHLGEDAWIRALERRLWPIRFQENVTIGELMDATAVEYQYVITDVRFGNEAVAIKRWGGEVWRVERPGFEGDGHASETEVNSIPVDRTFVNDGTLEDLAKWVDNVFLEGAVV